jgi:hypothetical protein
LSAPECRLRDAASLVAVSLLCGVLVQAWLLLLAVGSALPDGRLKRAVRWAAKVPE